jgi:aminopeptidase YwaD
VSRKNITALQIRDFLSGEFTPLPMSDVMAVLRAREKAGSVKITTKPAEVRPTKKR